MMKNRLNLNIKMLFWENNFEAIKLLQKAYLNKKSGKL